MPEGKKEEEKPLFPWMKKKKKEPDTTRAEKDAQRRKVLADKITWDKAEAMLVKAVKKRFEEKKNEGEE